MDENEIKRKEKEFWDEWHRENPDVVKDGIVNPAEYSAEKIKLLYLLKEVNGGKGWDLREFLKTGGRSQTWNNISRWSQGIIEYKKFFEWSEIEDIDSEYRVKWLNKISAINVKKIAGTDTSNMDEIHNHSRINAERIKMQIGICNPNIIICCGTEECYFKDIMNDTNPNWKSTSKGIWYVKEPSGRIIVSYLHPQARVKSCLLYYGLIDAIKEILS